MSEQKSMNGNGQDILTIGQAADLLQVSRQTFYRLRKEGQVPQGARVGDRLRFSRRELLEFVEKKS